MVDVLRSWDAWKWLLGKIHNCEAKRLWLWWSGSSSSEVDKVCILSAERSDVVLI
jgi:hypothetical protein